MTTPDDPPTPEPLGPSSLAWRYFSDWRGMLIGLWAGSMQNMHPALGAGVEEHSHFFEERWERLLRSLYPIAGVIYDGPDAVRTAREVRDYHVGIKGVDSKGRRYHALDPDTFFWAHATFVMVTVLICRYFGRPLTEEQKEQFYAESLQWYRLYGVSDRARSGQLGRIHRLLRADVRRHPGGQPGGSRRSRHPPYKQATLPEVAAGRGVASDSGSADPALRVDHRRDVSARGAPSWATAGRGGARSGCGWWAVPSRSAGTSCRSSGGTTRGPGPVGSGRAVSS